MHAYIVLGPIYIQKITSFNNIRDKNLTVRLIFFSLLWSFQDYLASGFKRQTYLLSKPGGLSLNSRTHLNKLGAVAYSCNYGKLDETGEDL